MGDETRPLGHRASPHGGPPADGKTVRLDPTLRFRRPADEGAHEQPGESEAEERDEARAEAPDEETVRIRGTVPIGPPAGDAEATATAAPEERDLLSLPTLPVPDPRELVSRDPTSPPPLARRRAPGKDPDGRARGGRAGAAGRRKPPLRPGTLLDGGRYEVTGYLAHGGQGWIHLAEDLRLERRPLVLKGLLDPHDETARLIALEERSHLVALDDANIVRILDYVTHHPRTGGGNGGDSGDGSGGTSGGSAGGGRHGVGEGGGDSGAGAGAGEPTDYIVMEFVGGKPLQQIIDETRQGARPLGPREPLTLEHAARYGCKILQALEYLHGKGLLYCDMKPENVIHHADRVKVIDLGAVRRMADTTTPSIATRRFAAPEVRSGGLPTVAHDLHTVGVTLRVLAEACEAGSRAQSSESRAPGARPTGARTGRAQAAGAAASDASAAAGLGPESFRRLVDRATETDPARRFASAAEMGHQLQGVLREMVSLRTRTSSIEPSALFEPSPALLDAGLGSVPPADRWPGGDATGAPWTPAPPLGSGRPEPREVAAGLPVPYPRPDDPAIVQLRLPASQDPRGVVRQLEAIRVASVEVKLRLCRTRITMGELDAAERLLAEAAQQAQTETETEARRGPGGPGRAGRPAGSGGTARSPGSAVPGGPGGPIGSRSPIGSGVRGGSGGGIGSGRDGWRISWHRGLLELARDRVQTAEAAFDRVYSALPGEYAPKLVLGYCAEHRGATGRAALLYEAVWQRNRQQGSAAFGLARTCLARGDRRAAADILDGVPPASRHHDAAAIAATRVRAARLAVDGSLPGREDLLKVIEQLPQLYLDGGAEHGDERTRLTAEIRGWALDWMREPGAAGEAAGLAGPLLGSPPSEKRLRKLLAGSLRAVAWLPGTDRRTRELLIDRANQVRPWTRF